MRNSAITVAITGASGVIYGLKLLQELIKANKQVYLVISKPAQIVINTETELKVFNDNVKNQEIFNEYCNAKPKQLKIFNQEQWFSPIASGSNITEAMIICPCTNATLSAIANGSSRNLIERAADVTLKEQRKLILVHRETPLSAIQLENMLKLAKIGVVIMPASPGFYNKPQNLDDIINFIVARILDHLNIEHNLCKSWNY
jgi:4-hydroxy-3-polyprenylbenzoate decarboxylase